MPTQGKSFYAGDTAITTAGKLWKTASKTMNDNLSKIDSFE